MLKGLNNFKLIIPDKYKLETQLVYAGEIEQTINHHQLMNWEKSIDGKLP